MIQPMPVPGASASRRVAFRAAVAAAAVLLSASCSSVTRPAAGDQAVLGSSAGTTPGAVAASPGAPVPGTQGNGPALTGASGVVASSQATAGSSAVANPTTNPVSGSGAAQCSAPVKLGVSWASDSGSGAAAGGASNTSSFTSQANNVQRLYQMGVDDVNRHGGIGGCPLQLVWYDFKAADPSTSYDQEAQDECTKFSQDAHVFAAVPEVHEGWVIASCLAQRHIPVIEGAPSETLYATSRDFESGWLFSPSQIAYDRLGGEIDLLHNAGYFDSGSRVGILVTDDGRGVAKHVVDDLWKPRLAALHVPVVATYTTPRINGFSALGEAGQQMGNAVLQFRRAGVDHILLAPGAGEDMFFFASAAQSQNYYPRVALDTTSRPDVAAGQYAQSLKDAVAVSWELNDVSAQAQQPATSATTGRSHCLELYKKPAAAANVPVQSLFGWCDVLGMLQASLSGAAGHPTIAAFQHGVAQLGDTLSLASGYGGAQLSTTQGDGGRLVRVMKFDQANSSWQYVSAPEALP
jgi:ABC-type branched-subunit amino acid transport system substrate-binding protein